MQSLNIYAYCGNNPIHRIDDGGDVWEAILFGALVGMGTQIISNVIEGKSWYEEVVGATVGGAVSVACGGLGGIMFGNAFNVSLNYIEANICGREYSDTEAATDLVSNILFEVGIGLSTGTIIEVIDPDTLEPTTKFAQYFKYKTDDKVIEELIENGIEYASAIVDTGRKIGVQYTFNKQKRNILHDYFFGE